MKRFDDGGNEKLICPYRDKECDNVCHLLFRYEKMYKNCAIFKAISEDLRKIKEELAMSRYLAEGMRE